MTREKVIDILKGIKDGTACLMPNMPEDGEKAIDIAIKAVEQFEPHWIPVEQDTPKEDDDYWCTFGAETGWFIDWCSWYHGRWVVWLDDIPNEVRNVIAWCKPFEPYRGVTE